MLQKSYSLLNYETEEMDSIPQYNQSFKQHLWLLGSPASMSSFIANPLKSLRESICCIFVCCLLCSFIEHYIA